MASPNYQPVSKSKFDLLKDSFKTATRSQLIGGIRDLFDHADGATVNLKKDDTLALADRLETEASYWSRSGYAEALESLKE